MTQLESQNFEILDQGATVYSGKPKAKPSLNYGPLLYLKGDCSQHPLFKAEDKSPSGEAAYKSGLKSNYQISERRS